MILNITINTVYYPAPRFAVPGNPFMKAGVRRSRTMMVVQA
jgi:hypothetical protein